jgi:hypothetical protein
MTTSYAGNYFPPEYKQFVFKEGDLLASSRGDGTYAVNKVLKVDRVDVKKGATIHIQGKPFVATEDDHLLVVSCAFGETQFKSLDEARHAARTGRWKVQIGHVPNRSPGAAAGQVLVGNSPVTESELQGYRQWKAAFDKGEASIF